MLKLFSDTPSKKIPYPLSIHELENRIAAGFLTENEFWATFLSCIDVEQINGGRLTSAVQTKLRMLVKSQILSDDKGNVLGTHQTLPLQFAGNTAWFVLDKTKTSAEYPMMFMTEEGVEQFSLTDVSILTLKRQTKDGLDLGYCFSGGLAKIIDPDTYDKEVDRNGSLLGYDNISRNQYDGSVSRLDPFVPNDAAGIKKNAASRNSYDKAKSILMANYTQAEWENFKLGSVVTRMLPNNSPAGGFRVQNGTTNVLDPSRVLVNACPSQETIHALYELLNPRVIRFWEKTLEKAPRYFVNDFIDNTPQRLKLPLSNTYMGYLTVDDINMLLSRTDKQGILGFDAYSFAYKSLFEMLKPGLFMYPHEFYFGLMCNVGLRLAKRNQNHFQSLITESAEIILNSMVNGHFEEVLTEDKLQNLLALDNHQDILTELEHTAYFDFDFFEKAYLLPEGKLGAAYLFHVDAFNQLKTELKAKFDEKSALILEAIDQLKANPKPLKK